MPNKVKFNIKNVHYAPVTESGFGTPVALPGAVSISLEQQGSLTPFYADGIKYYVSSSNNGYQGDLVMAMIDDAFRKAVLNETEDTKKVLAEDATKYSKEFALGFQIDGNNGPIYFWFLNCTATRPSVNASTNEDAITPQTDTLTVSCAPNASGIVRYKTTDDTDSTVITNWFNNVYTPTAS